MTWANLLGALGGGATAALLWLLLLPWDLSEVDAQGRMLERGGDDYGGAIAAVVSIVVAFALILLLLRRGRAGTSETSGANMFMVPLVFMVIPVAVIVPIALARFTARLRE